MAAYNGARWIEKQIDTILAQEGVDVTLHISIDPSSDETHEICDRYASRDSRVVVLPDAGRFGSAARNFFRLIRDVDFSGYDSIALADQDDEWYPEKLARACRVLSETSADAYSSNVRAVWPNGKAKIIKKDHPQKKWDYLFESPGPGCTHVFTIPLAEALQQFVSTEFDSGVNRIFFHDWLDYAFARSRGYQWVIDSCVNMDYRQHSSNVFGANAGIASIVTRFKTLLSGYAFSQVELLYRLLEPGTPPCFVPHRGLDRPSLLCLSLHSYQCRRRFLDCVAFGLMCVFFGLIGFRK
jgi:rhamnosyltransferase